ncbi:8-oxo-dGTP diphosphatase MutT [Agaribacterium sp. ZY112]|uniref:8-oxo-dGTP diphosphatase MutT n=1 Tax=Agaribacterium sp. ZY112 TaxID=3233574 RepID=UPI0035256D33
MPKHIRVVVGVIENEFGQILISQRQGQQHLAGLWEFPGGKLDAGESAEQALSRELKEELGIEVLQADFLFDIKHTYPEKSVCLHIFHVKAFSGVEQGLEGQPLRWLARADIDTVELPPANKAIVEWLQS